MDCRIDITGCKIWNDNDDEHKRRPASVKIVLLRDGDEYKTAEAKAAGGWKYKFACLPVWKNSEKYEYSIDEAEGPEGYTKKVEGYNVRNTLINFTAAGVKTWMDEHNKDGNRPESVKVNLLRNGAPFSTADVKSPPDEEDTAVFTFDNLPFADAAGKPYIYTVKEEPVEYYRTEINGFNINNYPAVP